VPEPTALATNHSVEDNQQLQVDVMKPTALIESLISDDTLATIFASKNGDPMQMGPRTFRADHGGIAATTPYKVMLKRILEK